MKNNNHIYKLSPELFFGALGIDAIIAGGLIAAFTAQHPSQFYSWVTAYLILVVGILQIGFSASLYLLAKKSSAKLRLLGFILYNIGNLCVILGTYLKHTTSNHTVVVNLGGILLGVSMLLFILTTRKTKRSWLKIVFYIFVAIILISMPIGLILAH